jgi:hypothetical protein
MIFFSVALAAALTTVMMFFGKAPVVQAKIFKDVLLRPVSRVSFNDVSLL